ncbi:uncharacterized protein LOC126892932 [Diabrotica virgifera virgifera]|uniref:Retrotransposon gag domain-containing protein n=1 Tax=Diabrotica virgifera virgifera TaxID=50390 RepID=A0ABM5L8P6_DIAVI|nr:uncharacterized protein LOC126892932 [Diabrotica virgifera virgifera]
MEYFKPPESFNVNEPQGWTKWKQKFEIFLLASGRSEAAEKIKVALLLNILGESCLDIFNTFPENKRDNFADVISCFDNHFLPKQNICMETFKFNNIQQKEGQGIDSFLTELKKQAANCGFICEKDKCKQSYADRMIKDRMVLGVLDKQVQRHLLRETTMSLDKMQEYCRSIEVTLKHVELLNTKEETEEINAVKFKFTRNCIRCDTKHEVRKCPAYNQTCEICNRKGQFSNLCFWKNKQRNDEQPSSSNEQGKMHLR